MKMNIYAKLPTAQYQNKFVSNNNSDKSSLVYQSIDMKVLMNHIYEYQKGVRNMVLFTCDKKYEEFASSKLQRQNIDFLIRKVEDKNINIFFGSKPCLDAIKLFANKPLSQMSPEEDFILGALLGYNICGQCERYCERKRLNNNI